MRAPRYRFPEEVRSTTRAMAARMIQEDRIVRTPEELETWISQDPGARASLERGGYGREFSARDLFPLLQAMLGPRAAPPPEADPPARAAGGRWLVMLVLAAIVVLLLLAVATDVFPSAPAEAEPGRAAAAHAAPTHRGPP